MGFWMRVASAVLVAGIAASAHAELDPFPTSSAQPTRVVFGVNQIEYFFLVGDQISETIATNAPAVSGAVLDLNIPLNSAQVDIDFAVFLNDTQIGAFSVPTMSTAPIHEEFEFAPITGPEYTLRVTETNEVPPGQGSLTIGTGAAVGSIALRPTPNHYACRQVKDATDPKFVKIADLPVEDSFGAQAIEAKKPIELCTPASQDGSVIVDPSAALCCYQVKAPKVKPPLAVGATDEFGDHEFGVGTTKRICQPCSLVF